MEKTKRTKPKKSMKKFFGHEHWIGAGKIIGQTPSSHCFTTLQDTHNYESMYSGKGIQITHEQKIAA